MTHANTDTDLAADQERDQNPDPDLGQLIWCDFDLEAVPAARVWKPESFAWALAVDWQLVNTLVRDHLDELAPALPRERLVTTTHWAGLSSTDREGLASLYAEPPYASTLQISSGGHRIEAMRRQGVRWALGQCMPSDVGQGVPDLHAYLPL